MRKSGRRGRDRVKRERSESRDMRKSGRGRDSEMRERRDRGDIEDERQKEEMER